MADPNSIGELTVEIKAQDKQLRAALVKDEKLVKGSAERMAQSTDKLTAATDRAGKSQELLGAAAAATGSAWLGQAAAVGGLGKSLLAIPALLNPITLAAVAVGAAMAVMWKRQAIADWIEGVKEAESELQELIDKLNETRKATNETLRATRRRLEELLGTADPETGTKSVKDLQALVNRVLKVQATSKTTTSERTALSTRIRGAQEGGMTPLKALQSQQMKLQNDLSNRVASSYLELKRLHELVADIERRGMSAEAIEPLIRNQETLFRDLQTAKILEEQRYQREVQRLTEERIKLAKQEAMQREAIAKQELQERLRLGVASKKEVQDRLRALAIQTRGADLVRRQMLAGISSLPAELQAAARKALGVSRGNQQSGLTPTSAFSGRSAVPLENFSRAQQRSLRQAARMRGSRGLGDRAIHRRLGLVSQLGPRATAKDAAFTAPTDKQSEIAIELKKQTTILTRMEREKAGLN